MRWSDPWLLKGADLINRENKNQSPRNVRRRSQCRLSRIWYSPRGRGRGGILQQIWWPWAKAAYSTPQKRPPKRLLGISYREHMMRWLRPFFRRWGGKMLGLLTWHWLIHIYSKKRSRSNRYSIGESSLVAVDKVTRTHQILYTKLTSSCSNSWMMWKRTGGPESRNLASHRSPTSRPSLLGAWREVSARPYYLQQSAHQPLAPAKLIEGLPPTLSPTSWLTPRTRRTSDLRKCASLTSKS